jgi:hypothetical protein
MDRADGAGPRRVLQQHVAGEPGRRGHPQCRRDPSGVAAEGGRGSRAPRAAGPDGRAARRGEPYGDRRPRAPPHDREHTRASRPQARGRAHHATPRSRIPAEPGTSGRALDRMGSHALRHGPADAPRHQGARRRGSARPLADDPRRPRGLGAGRHDAPGGLSRTAPLVVVAHPSRRGRDGAAVRDGRWGRGVGRLPGRRHHPCRCAGLRPAMVAALRAARGGRAARPSPGARPLPGLRPDAWCGDDIPTVREEPPTGRPFPRARRARTRQPPRHRTRRPRRPRTPGDPAR